MEMTGAKILMECLLEQGVNVVFGYPGGTILNIYDEIYNYKDKIKHILTSHEQGASHAADGYARSTGKVGVCFATSGPGATNLTTGIATAYMDSVPVVFISCNVNDNLIGKDTFQEVDLVGITMPITKCNYLVKDVKKLADVVHEAFAIARSGRKGPVLIDIVKDEENRNGTLTPKQILSSIARMLPQDTMVATDVGQHQMWAIQHFHFDYPGQLITSGGFGTMGFGLGAAIGAKIGNPDKAVILITGDGSFRMNLTELSTVEHYNLPIIIFIFNNGVLGMVRQWQSVIYKNHYSETMLDRGPDFVKIANAYGLSGSRITNVKELETAINETMSSKKAYIIDCSIYIDEMVRPMVSGGSDISDFIVN